MIHDAIAAALPEMRAHAESLMQDSGRALRRSGEPVYDPAEQASVVPELELFASRCKIQASNAQASVQQIGERSAVLSEVSLHLPATTAPLAPDDEWEVLTVGPLSSVPVGRRYRVIAPFEKTWATARRYKVEEVVT